MMSMFWYGPRGEDEHSDHVQVWQGDSQCLSLHIHVVASNLIQDLFRCVYPVEAWAQHAPIIIVLWQIMFEV